MKASMSNLRRGLSGYVAKARAGARIQVTVRGTVVAELVPVATERQPDLSQADAALQRLIAIRKDCFVGDVVTPLDG